MYELKDWTKIMDFVFWDVKTKLIKVEILIQKWKEINIGII